MISLTCNKKAYPGFMTECNKCPMMVECVINNKSVAVEMLECPAININITVNQDARDITTDDIAQMFLDNLNRRLGR